MKWLTEDGLDDEKSQESLRLQRLQKKEELHAFRTLKINTKKNVATLLSHEIPENKFTRGLDHAKKIMKKWKYREISRHPATLDFVRTVNAYITNCAWGSASRKITFERNTNNAYQLDELEAKYAAYLAEINGSTTPDSLPSDTQ